VLIDMGTERRENLFSTDAVQQTIDHCRDVAAGDERAYWQAMHGHLTGHVTRMKQDATFATSSQI
jgi:hypothetical protein